MKTPEQWAVDLVGEQDNSTQNWLRMIVADALRNGFAARDAEIERLRTEVSSARSWAAEVLSGKHAQEMNEARAEIERLKAIANATKDEGLEEMRKKFRLRDEIDAAREYAGRLFLHYHPECELQPDLMGVLTQIDNAMTVIPALRTERDDLRRRVGELEAALAAERERLEALRINVFRSHWCGTIGRPQTWHVQHEWARRFAAAMHGDTIGEAIDAAVAANPNELPGETS